MTPLQLAIVRLPTHDQVRPAAFVFPDDQGVTWLEPGYLDPFPSSRPGDHRLDGELVANPPGFDLVVADQVVAEFRPLGTPGADDSEGTCTAALLDFTDALVVTGRTLEQERALVAAALSAQAQALE